MRPTRRELWEAPACNFSWKEEIRMFVRISETKVVNAEFIASAQFTKAEGSEQSVLRIHFDRQLSDVGSEILIAGALAVETWNALTPAGKIAEPVSQQPLRM
jgi:hypothetical protein